MKLIKYCILFIGLIAVFATGGYIDYIIPPYKIDEDYRFEDGHTITTGDGWTFQINELKKYNVSGKVVGIRYYRENHVPFAPVDFCIGRGKVVEPPHDKWIDFSMGYRCCGYRYDYRIALNEEYLFTQISNNHLIPSDKNTYDQLMDVNEGDVIEVRGTLVSVGGKKKDGTTLRPWTSSTSESDRDFFGWGRCEIILVEDIEVFEKAPQKLNLTDIFVMGLAAIFIIFNIYLFLIWKNK
ncbi:MAG: hypothetical protein A7316_03180 [Candidatus Altiarchaeales archaeon WOR_SM1_86-2]|nr:MAG: hypothetical protein A7316_03180 [Candidatus Altiarchaeales archaeon WOR_SM1_86-2]